MRVYLLAIIAVIGAFLYGYQYGVIAAVLPDLCKRWELGAASVGAFVSSLLFVAMGATLFGGVIASKIGRKRALILNAALFIIGNMMMLSLFSLPIFWGGRVVAGLAVGLTSVVLPLYLAEISPPKIRGLLVSLNQMAITVGILVGFIIGAFMDDGWFLPAAILSALYFCLLFILPESPIVLWKHHHRSEFFNVAEMLLGSRDEEKARKAFLESSTEEKALSLRDFWHHAKKPFTVAAILTILQQASGINAVVFYGVLLLEKSNLQLTDFTSKEVMLVIASLNVLATFLYLFLIDRLGRKFLLLIGSATMSVAMFMIVVGLYFTSALTVMASIALFILAFATSFGPTAILVASEIFPLDVRGKAMSLTFVIGWLANGLIVFSFPLLLEAFGMEPSLLFFSLVSLCSFFFVLTRLPETRQKSLEEIQSFWRSK